MRRIFSLLIAFMAAAVVAGCGSATEVGNPTGEVPQIIMGKIDSASLPEYFLDIGVAEASTSAVELASLTVVATSEDGYESLAQVNTDGNFSIGLYAERAYSMVLEHGLQTVAEFSFEQDAQGNRANRLYFSRVGSEMDLGLCVYQGGEIFPENEPRGHSNWGGPHGP